MKHAFFLLKHIFLIFWMLAATSCSKKTKEQPKTLVIGIENEIKNLDLRTSQDQNVWKLSLLTTQALMDLNSKGQLIPELALGYKIHDNRKIVLDLDHQYFFHNGSAVTCDDVLYSYKDAQRPGSRLLSYLNRVEKFECDTSGNFIVELKEPLAEIFMRSVIPMIRVLPRKFASHERSFQKKPMGSGPYQFISQRLGKIILKAYKKYPKKIPFEEIIILPLHSAHTHILSLIAGDIDMSWASLDEKILPDLRSYPNLRAYHEAGTILYYIGLNTKKPLLSDSNFRKTLFMATQRNKLFNEKLGGLGTLAEGFFPVGHDNFTTLWPSTSITESPKPFSIKHQLNLKIPAQEELRSWAQALKISWENLNIDLKIESYEFARFIDDLKSENYSLFLYKVDTRGDPDILYQLFHSSQTPPRLNRFFVKSLALDRLLEKGRSLRNGTPRNAVYKRAQELIAQEHVLIPLWFPTNTVLGNEKIKAWTGQDKTLVDFLTGR